jgi:hypothetical protein
MKQDEKERDARIEAMMKGLTLEKAPASLSARLHRIPDEESRRVPARKSRWGWLNGRPAPRWALVPAMAAVPLLVIVVMLMQPSQPSQAEIEQARRDLAVAFTYLDKVGVLTGNEIQAVLGGELRHIVKEPLSEHMPFTEQSLKEKST